MSRYKVIIFFIGMIWINLEEATAVHFFPEEDTEFGVRATHPGLRIEDDLSVPDPVEDGKIPTLNQTGFMTPDQSVYNEAFLDMIRRYVESGQPPRVLDIGAAYGITSIPALELGAKVVANDIDERHLLLLREKVPALLRENLILNKHSFPNEAIFPADSFDIILLCRVGHFFTGEEMESSILKAYSWLKPGGSFIITTLSPYHHIITEFLPVYQKRAESGAPWPGMIDNMHEFAPHLKDKIPNFLHVMDRDSLGVALEKYNFTIRQEGRFDYMRPKAKKSDGQGYYGVIAQKPATA